MEQIKNRHEKNEMLSIDEMGSIGDEVNILAEKINARHRIDPNLYIEYDVKRGLRDSTGKGVLTGLTEISDVIGFDMQKGIKVPADGSLYYQGIDVKELIKGSLNRRFGFEETTYLLLFGKLPDKDEMKRFNRVSSTLRELSGRFVRDVVMKASNENIMNAMQRCVLTLYTYDAQPDDISSANVLRQSLELINKIPLISVYSYHSYMHFRKDKPLIIKPPKSNFSTAENMLYMLRPDGKFSKLEAKVLDTALILHAEHGGGNNSSFTTHVVSSSGTDTYSAISASIGSLKGPRHGGANLKVQQMFDDIKKHVRDWEDEEQLTKYLNLILDKKAFDRTGLIYGMGHAVYTLSDPREVILKAGAKKLAAEKGRMHEFTLYENIERIAGKLIMEKRNLQKYVCPNVDFYSGFVYSMLGIPYEMFTPIFAIARMPGWCAHRLEEIMNTSKIIRPAYKYVGTHTEYIPPDER